MARLSIAWLAALVPFCLLDFAWLSTMGPRLYKPALGDLMAEAPRPGPAIAFYALYLAGLAWFAVRPASEGGDWRSALVNGALFGFFAYATYDLTNQATLRNWPMRVTVLDIAWGAFASALAAVISSAVTARLMRAS
jgi:uncharacterized membrane protein